MTCEALADGDDPDACYLIAEHPREHAWDTYDRNAAAELREARRRNPNFARKYT
ncbi:hypothetical protein PV682_42140 [Streptomyces niveiscabiei]|uniref:hypothetical protein n=1 Tax=Streptomyces niveiscabiei TaxID=164115 RepID=UPI0029B49285|nr:hypothetical protein [Streptomyces niveiscabiei]MDX3387996.1 hypothetical protein [Streptomyces niveiscabiei]